MLELLRKGLVEYLGSLELATDPPALHFQQPGPGWYPADAADPPGLNVYCVTLEEHDARSRRPHPELRLGARFLVTAWSADADAEQAGSQAEALLGRLWRQLSLNPMARDPEATFFAEMLQEPVPPELWLALGLPPRPALWLRAVAVEEKPVPPVKPVEYRVIRGLDSPGTTTLSGKVVDADGEPVAGAVVALPELGRRTRSDQLGNFVFVEVSPDPLPLVVAELGGARSEARAAAQADGLAPLIVELQPQP